MEGAPGSSCAFPQDGITERGLCSPVEIPLKWVSVRPSLPPFFPLSPLIFLFLMSLCLPPLLQSAVMFRAFSPLLGFPLSFLVSLTHSPCPTHLSTIPPPVSLYPSIPSCVLFSSSVHLPSSFLLSIETLMGLSSLMDLNEI